ncbi:MAG TPA: hypothetical protein VHW25_13395 [Steroidobacteraceae bacterium]|jgi:hypothetical protein|nr:hypothetical protein [Steroidobacteraceae bacterium]
MSDERTEEFSEPRLNIKLAVSGNGQSGDAARNDPPRTEAQGKDDNRADNKDDKKRDESKAPLSEAKVRMQSRLPALDDDADIGVEKEHIVTRDGKADLLFMGALLASAASDSAPKGTWQEYRIYRTNGDKYVFSKATRNIRADKEDGYEADVFEPAPSSVPSQLLRGAREIARARPVTWMDAAVSFFGYDPLAKVLYRKLSVRFEEQIT